MAEFSMVLLNYNNLIFDNNLLKVLKFQCFLIFFYFYISKPSFYMQKKVIGDFFVEISMNLSLFKAKIMVFFYA